MITRVGHPFGAGNGEMPGPSAGRHLQFFGLSRNYPDPPDDEGAVVRRREGG